MKKTLFRQMIISMLLFCIAICIAGYLVIELLFDDYYYDQQQQVLYSRTNEAARQIDEGGDVSVVIDSFDSEYGVSLHYANTAKGIFSGQNTHGMMGRQSVYSSMTADNVGKFFVTTSGQGMNESQWLSYLTELSDGALLLGRISYGSMDAVVGVVQQFFLYFGIASAAAFVLFAFFFSRSMSRPLHKLNDIAAGMGQLNFSLRYEGRRQDEIGQLGATLNTLMTQLESTIMQLKGELSKEKTLEKMRTQFTAQVSHELQTPLAVIKGYAEALSDNLYQTDEKPEAYQTLIDEADKISSMVDDLLDLSQIEAGAYVLSKEKFNFTAMIDRLYARYRTLFGGKRIDMKTTLGDEVLFFGDERRLEQAVGNVLSNAVKYARLSGHIGIALDKHDGTIRVAIENEGEPIDEKDLPHIFESYYRAQTAVKGTGLGLSISRHIIALHGGSITAANSKKGVLFEIRLPFES